MKTVILAGGLGTRLSEETDVRPKPMVEIGGIPILVHVMRIYAAAGFEEFVVALGYKGTAVKEYFRDFGLHNSDLELRLGQPDPIILHENGGLPNWHIVLADTGGGTETGGRIKRLEHWLGDEERFFLTYGDGVADIDIRLLLEFHKSHGKIATVTAVRPPARFGDIAFNGSDLVDHFGEKTQAGAGWINGGFFVLERAALDYISGDDAIWEREPLERLAADGQLAAYRHEGFWQPMDTLREKRLLEELWASGRAPWKVW
jgi:glucose-1-phosphate cytidylyltransferase